MYTKQVLKHFQNPHNQGKMSNPTVVGNAGNPICGDTMRVYLKVGSGKTSPNPSLSRRGNTPLTSHHPTGLPLPAMSGTSKRGIIEDIKFETLGCAAAIASSSVLTDMVKGKTLDYAENITKEDVVKKLGGLPEHKVHCSLIAVDALKDAIDKLRQKEK